MATVPKQANLGYFGPFMAAYGRAGYPARLELYRDTQAYSGGRETAVELYAQVADLLGVSVPPGEALSAAMGTAAQLFYEISFSLCRSLSSLIRGTRRAGGYLKRYVSIIAKVRGTRTQGTATTAGCSSCYPLGVVSAEWFDLTWLPPVNSSTVPGTFTFVTAAPGVSGVPLELVGSDE